MTRAPSCQMLFISVTIQWQNVREKLLEVKMNHHFMEAKKNHWPPSGWICLSWTKQKYLFTYKNANHSTNYVLCFLPPNGVTFIDSCSWITEVIFPNYHTYTSLPSRASCLKDLSARKNVEEPGYRSDNLRGLQSDRWVIVCDSYLSITHER